MIFKDYTVVKAWFKRTDTVGTTIRFDYELFVKTGDYWHIPGNEAFWLESDEELKEWANAGLEILAEPNA